MIDENKLIERIQQDSTEFESNLYKDAGIRAHFIDLIRLEAEQSEDAETSEKKDLINVEAIKRELRAYVSQHIDFNGDSKVYLPVKIVWRLIHSAPKADSYNSDQGDSLISRKSLEGHLSLCLSRSSLGEIPYRTDISLGSFVGLIDNEPVVKYIEEKC